MPWNKSQLSLFGMIASGKIPPKKGLTRAKARELAKEGLKPSLKKKPRKGRGRVHGHRRRIK